MTTEVAQPMLWQAFEKTSNAALNWSPTAFKFTVGSTPLSTLAQVAGAIGLYYVVIFGGRELMRNRKPFGLSEVNKYHNLNLTLISGGLLALMLEQLVPSLLQNGLRFNMCGNAGFTPSLTTLYYLNYLTKYLEFADTVLLVLRKKPLTFLHTYHHGATAFLCYTQLIGHTPIAWVPIVLNLGVHVLMYWYYYRASCGVKSWYKEYITIMQIVQFVIDLAAVYFVSFNLFANSGYFGKVAQEPVCSAHLKQWTADLLPEERPLSEIAALTGLMCLTSYLFLFVAFYFATYKTGGKTAKKSKTPASVSTVASNLLVQSEKVLGNLPVVPGKN